MQDTVDGDARPFVRWVAARSVWDVSVGRPAAPAALEQYVAISEQIRGPIYLFGARYAQSRFFTEDDVDVDCAIELLDEAIETAAQVGERKALGGVHPGPTRREYLNGSQANRGSQLEWLPLATKPRTDRSVPGLQGWARRDSNPGPLPCHGSALTN